MRTLGLGLGLSSNGVPFDPSQLPGYNFDYNVASLTAGAITAWPSNAGLTDTPAHFRLTGTATAHATGGSGNGPWVETVRASANILRESNQSSETVAKEVWMVARYTTTGGTNGTIYDGGAGNDSRLFRPSAADEITVFGLGPNACPVGLLETWSVWRAIADGVNVSLTIGGHVILAPTALATTFINGVTLGNFGAGGGDAADAGFERVLGFSVGLTSLQAAALTSFLKGKYSL